MGYEDLLNAEPEKENLTESESFLVKKLDELMPMMVTILTRVAILEGQIAFLLAKDPEYVEALEKYAAAQEKEAQDGVRNI